MWKHRVGVKVIFNDTKQTSSTDISGVPLDFVRSMQARIILKIIYIFFFTFIDLPEKAFFFAHVYLLPNRNLSWGFVKSVNFLRHQMKNNLKY